MHDSKHCRAAGPKDREDRSRPGCGVKNKPRLAPDGQADHDGTKRVHPVDRVYGLLRKGTGTDKYLEEIRGE